MVDWPMEHAGDPEPEDVEADQDKRGIPWTPYLCSGCRDITRFKFLRPRKTFMATCRKCRKYRRHHRADRRPLTRPSPTDRPTDREGGDPEA